MITLIASAIGFLSSAFPDMMRLYKDKKDKAYEIEIMKLKMESQRLGQQGQLQEIDKKAQISEQNSLYQHASISSGIKWVEGIKSSVRPIVTYCFFALFAIIKIATLVALFQEGASIAQGFVYLWDEDTKALFSAIISFWFGHRALEKLRG